MHPTPTAQAGDSEVAILARVLGNEDGQLPAAMARYFLNLGLSQRDKARMHDLAVRNQADALSPAEKELLFAYAKAGTLLSILKSRARRVLKIKPKRRTPR
ncbi:MAG TPA: hypothetical protein VG013_32395 [Gemmataceae bacterium]|jgi:hypothetical protein|nr:hypothetical protein [Gemmataceae bacterium]